MSHCREILLRFVLFASLLMLIAGCVSPVSISNRSPASFNRDPMQIARLSCFLSLKTVNGAAMRMEVNRLELLAGDTWLPLLNEPQLFDSNEIGSGQVLIGAQNVPPGDYRRMRIEVARAEVIDFTGNYAEVLSEPQWFEIDSVGLQNLAVDDSKTILLSWDIDASLDSKNRFSPAMLARSTAQQIWSDLLFVSCPEIDTIFIIRTDNNQVVSSFGLTGGPTYMALDPRSGGRQLYVLCSRDRLIKVVDLDTYRVAEFFAVPLNDDPSYMLLSGDGNYLYMLDEKNGYLTLMSTDTGQIITRSFLDYQPNYLHYLPEQNLLAVSLALSQQVLLLDPNDLRIAGAFSTGSFPGGLLDVDNQLYIAERDDNRVRVIDLSSHAEQNRLVVGLGPRRMIAAGGQIYVANAFGGSLSVLESGGFGVVQSISGIGMPGEMALNTFYRRIYIADEGGDGLSVVDVNSNRVLKRIKLGALPFGLTVIQ